MNKLFSLFKLKSLFTVSLIFLSAFALSAQRASISLTWDNNPETDLGGYRVYYGPATRSYTNYQNVGKTNICTVTNLVDNASYFFAVTAFNTNGLESDYSNEVRLTTGRRPAAPTNLSGTQNKDIVYINFGGKTTLGGGKTIPIISFETAETEIPVELNVELLVKEEGFIKRATLRTTNGLASLTSPKGFATPFDAEVNITGIKGLLQSETSRYN